MNVENVKKLFAIFQPDAAKAIKNHTLGEFHALAMYQSFKLGYSLGEKKAVVVNGEVQDQVSTDG